MGIGLEHGLTPLAQVRQGKRDLSFRKLDCDERPSHRARHRPVQKKRVLVGIVGAPLMAVGRRPMHMRRMRVQERSNVASVRMHVRRGRLHEGQSQRQPDGEKRKVTHR